MNLTDYTDSEELMEFYENTVDEQIAFTQLHESLFDETQTTNTHTPYWKSYPSEKDKSKPVKEKRFIKLSYLRCVAETKKAILVKTEGGDAWFPKSIVKHKRKRMQIKYPVWFDMKFI